MVEMRDAAEPREMTLMRLKASHLLGWWCQYGPNGVGRGHNFHEDPVEMCPGPHVPCYSWPEEMVR